MSANFPLQYSSPISFSHILILSSFASQFLSLDFFQFPISLSLSHHFPLFISLYAWKAARLRAVIFIEYCEFHAKIEQLPASGKLWIALQNTNFAPNLYYYTMFQFLHS